MKKTTLIMALGLLLAAQVPSVFALTAAETKAAATANAAAKKAATAAAKTQFTADSKKALELYKEDQTLCGGETTSAGRLQCKRDAKAEYDKALSAAKTRMVAASNAPVPAKAPACADCGRVVSVNQSEKAGESTALGVIAGGAAGALLGNQVGGGVGKDLATIAGAVGGAYAGKKIEEKVKSRTVWTVEVQYPDGRKTSFEFDKDPGMAAGDAVKNSGNTVVRN
jgi:outer membrane lipoprotein SlyB